MPLTLPSGMATEMAKQAVCGSIALLDLETVDGSQYFWTDNDQHAGQQYPSKITGANQNYSPWLESVGPITISNDFTTDAGDIVIQNLSGNTIDRDVAAALVNHEFEGALAILRLWLPLFDDSMMEFHGYLAEQQLDDEQVTFRLLQLVDLSQFNIADDVISELCTWRFKSAQCGSTGIATVCPKRLVDCQDATRLAQERFNGCLPAPPANAIVNIPPVVTIPTGPISGGGGGGGVDGPTGPRRPVE